MPKSKSKHLPKKAFTRPASGPPTGAIDPDQPLAEALSAWADLCQRWGSWLAKLLRREDFNAHSMARDQYDKLSQDIIVALAAAWEEGGPLDPRRETVVDRCRCEMPQPKAEIIVEIWRELSAVCDDAWKCAFEGGLCSGHGVAVAMATKTIPSIAERLLGLSKGEPPIRVLADGAETEAAGKRSGQSGAQKGQAAPEKPDNIHNADFTEVRWLGMTYTFSPKVQAKAVEALWVEWETTGLSLHQQTIGKHANAEDGFRMDAHFRNHPAFGKMIKADGDGRYRLCQCKPNPKK